MSERNGYEHGVPCWVDTWRADPDTALGFYTQLLGWEAEQTMPEESSARYFMCRLRGRDVAAIGSPLPPGAPEAAWTTYVWMDDADAAAAKAREAGGSVVAEPTEGLDGGRVAIVADPAGAAIGIWQPGGHKGAQLVNEPSAWSMSVLNTPDPESAAAFYGSVFGWTTESFGPVTMFRLPGYEGGEPGQPVSREVVATMAPMGDDRAADTPPHWGVDFWVAGADELAERAGRLGGSVVAPPADLPGAPLRQGVVADPEGAALSVTELRVPG